MQITQTKSEELKREYTVTMTAEEIDQRINERLTELGKSVKMPGFRPGKVPLNLLKSKYGKAVMGEVLEHAVNDTTVKAINENNLRPAARPKIEVKSFEEGKGLEYTMAIEILPEIVIADFEGIEIEKMTAAPKQKDVDEALERIAKANKTTEKIEEKRPCAIGDICVIDFDGTVDGKPFPGMQGTEFPLELGSKSFIEGFEDQIIGAQAGDEKTVNVTFPKDYGHEQLQGIDAVFKVKVKELRTAVVPAIDDEFAKKIGFEDLSKIKETVEKQIQDEYDQLARLVLKRALLDKLDEKHDFQLPEGMVESEFQGIMQQIKGGQGHAQDDPDHVHGPDCAHEHGTDEDREEYFDIAARRVKLGLVLAEIGRINKIEVTNQEIQQAVINEARKYPGKEREVFEYYQQNSQAVDAVRAPIYEDKVVDFILETSKISSRQVDIEELTKASEQEPPKKAKSASKATKSSKPRAEEKNNSDAEDEKKTTKTSGQK